MKKSKRTTGVEDVANGVKVKVKGKKTKRQVTKAQAKDVPSVDEAKTASLPFVPAPGKKGKKKKKTVAAAVSLAPEVSAPEDVKGTKRSREEPQEKVAEAGCKPKAKKLKKRSAKPEVTAASLVQADLDDGHDSDMMFEPKVSTEDKNNRKVFVGGIPFAIEEDTLKRDFDECGEIDEYVYPVDDQGRHKGIAFFTFKTQAGVDAALAFNDTDYAGRSLKVAMATHRRDSGKGDSDKGKGRGKGKEGKGDRGDKGKDGKGKDGKGKKGKGKDRKGKDGKGKSGKSGKGKKG